MADHDCPHCGKQLPHRNGVYNKFCRVKCYKEFHDMPLTAPVGEINKRLGVSEETI